MINRIDVRLGGLELKKFIFLNLTQPFDSQHILEIHVRFEDANELVGKSEVNYVDLRDLTQKWAGERITATIKQGEVDSSDNFNEQSNQTFVGIVKGIQILMNDAIDNTLVIYAECPTMLFKTGVNTRTFSEQSLSEIVEDVIKPFKGLLNAKISPEFSEIIPYTTQYNESNYHFLQRLAETYGEWFFYDGEELVFGKTGRSKTEVAKLEYRINLKQMEYELRLVPTIFKAGYYTYFKDEILESKSGDQKACLPDFAQTALAKSEQLFSEETLDIISPVIDSESALSKSVKQKKSRVANDLALLKGTSTSLKVRLGAPVSIKNDIKENEKLVRTDDYGSFTITSIRHYVDSRGFYQNTFEAIPQDIDSPPAQYNSSLPVASSQPARVIDTNDPEKIGRVKVRFYWQNDDQTTPWVRVANLMSGGERGVYFVPEIDEVVFVDFEMGNPDMPFVRGSMFTGNAKPGGELFKPDNNIKGIVTKSGNTILIDDSGGKEKIHIYNPGSKNQVIMSLDSEPHIEVKSEGKIRIEAKEIEMKAEKISMNAQQDWMVEANKGSIEARAKIQVSAAAVNIEGKSQTSVKGNAQLALEGGAEASLKAAMVLIN